MLRLAWGIAFGCTLWLLNHFFILAAFLKQDPRYEPLLAARGQDTAQYFSWIKTLAHAWSIPNYFAPWHTDASHRVPLLWLVGQMNRIFQLPEGAIYIVVHVALYAVTGVVFLRFLAFFTRSRRDAMLCTLAMVCILPTRAYLMIPLLVLRGQDSVGWRWSSSFDTFAAGASADGFFQGVAASLTITLGTMGALLALLLIGRYLTDGQPRHLWAAAIANGLLTLFHPFEFATLLPASALAMLYAAGGLQAKLVRDWVILGAPSVAALLVYVAGAGSPWLAVAADLNRIPQPFTLDRLSLIGLPLLLLAAAVLFRMRAAQKHGDVLLSLFVIVTIVVFFLPFAPWPRLSGVYYAAAIAGVHRWCDVYSAWVPRSLQKLAAAGACAVLALAIFAHVYFRYESFRLGLQATVIPDSVSAVASKEERAVHAWLAKQPQVDRQLVLAPHEYAAWFATIPMHTFGSHFLFSLTYSTQRDQADRFFAGALAPAEAQRLLTLYGVHWILIPAGNGAAKGYAEAAGATSRFQTESLELYEIAGAGMRPFPKLTKTAPGRYEWLEAR